MRDVLLITSCCALEVVGQTPLCCRIGVSPVLKVSVCLVKDKEEDRPLDGTLAVGFSKNLAERKEGQQLKIGGLIVGLVGWFSRFSNSNFFFQFLPPPLFYGKKRGKMIVFSSTGFYIHPVMKVQQFGESGMKVQQPGMKVQRFVMNQQKSPE